MTQKTSGTKAELIEEIQTRGAWKAYQASLDIVENPRASTSARAQSASNILRAGGYFAAGQGDALKKEPHEMSADELQEAVEKMVQQLGNKNPNVFD